MTKKILSFILCGIISLSFSACGEETSKNSSSAKKTTSALETEESGVTATTVFDTENIEKITFYSYYGMGTGSVVPDENMDEIINWLSTFTFKKKGEPRDGDNFNQVQIEYADGSIIKKGLTSVSFDGVLYYIEGEEYPYCFNDIISKTSHD